MFLQVRRRIIISTAALTLLWGCSTPPSTEPTDGNQASAEGAAKTLTIYSGRDEKIMGPLMQKAREDLGLDIEVRYGDSTELAIALIEEGENSPADVFYSQDAGALGAVAQEERTLTLPESLLQNVDAQFRSPSGQWVGISGRARVIDYNTQQVESSELPDSVLELTAPQWRGKVGWAPTNGSFQSFVSAMRVLEGDPKTLEWLQAMKANEAKSYDGNTAIVEALGRGEVALGLVNNYYLYRFKTTDPDFPVALHHTDGGAGALINVAGLAVLKTTDQQRDAEQLIGYMLSPEIQEFITREFYEYPLVPGISVSRGQAPLEELQNPNLDLSQLADLDGTLALLQEAGLL